MAGETASAVRSKRASRESAQEKSARKSSQKIIKASLKAGIDSPRAARAAIEVKIDPSRDALLTNFGRATLVDRYLLAGETPQDLFARVARA